MALGEDLLRRIRAGEAMGTLLTKYTDARNWGGTIDDRPKTVFERPTIYPGEKHYQEMVFSLLPGELMQVPLDRPPYVVLVRRDE